jgi:hypothetical protein
MKFALLAVGAAAAKMHHDPLHLPVFHPSNFMNANVARTMIKSLQQGKTVTTGEVTYNQCSDSENKFTFDESMTTVAPYPVTKGTHLTFDLGGIVSSPMEVDGVHVHVNWNGTPLYDEDVKVGKEFDSTVDIQFGWDVPSYAPSGKYEIHVTG